MIFAIPREVRAALLAVKLAVALATFCCVDIFDMIDGVASEDPRAKIRTTNGRI